MKKFLYFFFTVWMMLWLQVISNHFLGGTLFSVQWILIAVLHYGLRNGPWTGETLGFIWGIFIDAASLGLLGIHAILYTLAGYSAGMFRRQLDASKIWTQAIFTWMVSMVYFALYMLVDRFFSMTEGTFQWAFLTVPIINAVAAPFIFRVLDQWAEVWDMEPIEHH
jgi:rod shape-determining protein MreD